MRYSVETTATATQVIALARQAFGVDGAGLRMVAVGILDISFSSPAGSIAVVVEPRPGHLNEVIIETRELDREVRAFLTRLPRQSVWRSVTRWLRSKRIPSATP